MLALDSCEYDLESDVGVEALLLLDAMLDIPGNSKCIEDTHSHLRYLGAKAKNSISSRASRFHACITSKVLEGRGVNTRGLDDVKLALASWSSSFQTKPAIDKKTQTASVSASLDMLNIMKDEHTSPSYLSGCHQMAPGCVAYNGSCWMLHGCSMAVNTGQPAFHSKVQATK